MCAARVLHSAHAKTTAVVATPLIKLYPWLIYATPHSGRDKPLARIRTHTARRNSFLHISNILLLPLVKCSSENNERLLKETKHLPFLVYCKSHRTVRDILYLSSVICGKQFFFCILKLLQSCTIDHQVNIYKWNGLQFIYTYIKFVFLYKINYLRDQNCCYP